MTVLRLVAMSGTALDPALATVAVATLARREDGRYLELPGDDLDAIVRALAFGGIAATPCKVDLSLPRALHPAVGRDLAPVGGMVGVDLLRVRRVPVGEATAEILRRRIRSLRPASAVARVRCRALLRGDEHLLAWDRRAWATRPAFRDGQVRAHLRPIVFDREALTDGEMHGRTFASEGAIGAWMFG